MELDGLYLLVPANVSLAAVALALFIWAIPAGQFDDLDTPRLRRRRAYRVMRQNLAIAVVHNLCAIPLAMAGWVIPLVAAISMSLSSLLVVLNALRLRVWGQGGKRAGGAQPVAVVIVG